MQGKKRLSLALRTAADISKKTADLKVIMEQMGNKKREIFKDLIKGEHIVKVFIKRGLMSEIHDRMPYVTLIDDARVDITDLKWRDYDDCIPQDKVALRNQCMNFIGREYKDFIVDVKWMFKMLSLDAVKTVAQIMEDKKVSPQTRLLAAQDVLSRAGYEGEKETTKEKFPVNVVIRYDKKPTSERVIEGEEVYAETNPNS